ncbi:uncharacterized protein LOC134804558 [Cydia splendana]|uniref:uncharacterized protein LOC134804558 n=1 Tax=Cydia splendana TaxID=1100963 RepID=UPI00300C0478
MRPATILLLLCCTMATASAEVEQTKDLELDNPEDLERRHRRRKKPQNTGPCASGYGRTFGFQDYTYISAPVMNYFFGCGVAPVPVAPLAHYPQLPAAAPYPVQIGVSQSQHHQGGHHGGHHAGHHGHGHFGGQNQGGQFIGNYASGHDQNQPFYGPGAFQQPNRPLQNVVSAAASGFGNVLADYINRPRKTQKQINRQVNQFLKPIYKLF